MNNIKLLPCPFCGMEPEDDLIDTLYRSGIMWRNHTRPDGTTMRSYHGRDAAKDGDGWCWTMHCTQNQGGCGAEISGDSEQEAIDRWNRRVISENANTITLTKYVLVYQNRDGYTFVYSAIKPTRRAKELATFIFAPGIYTEPMKDRYGVFSNSQDNIPSNDELTELMGY